MGTKDPVIFLHFHICKGCRTTWNAKEFKSYITKGAPLGPSPVGNDDDIANKQAFQEARNTASRILRKRGADKIDTTTKSRRRSIDHTSATTTPAMSPVEAVPPVPPLPPSVVKALEAAPKTYSQAARSASTPETTLAIADLLAAYQAKLEFDVPEATTDVDPYQMEVFFLRYIRETQAQMQALRRDFTALHKQVLSALKPSGSTRPSFPQRVAAYVSGSTTNAPRPFVINQSRPPQQIAKLLALR